MVIETDILQILSLTIFIVHINVVESIYYRYKENFSNFQILLIEDG